MPLVPDDISSKMEAPAGGAGAASTFPLRQMLPSITPADSNLLREIRRRIPLVSIVDHRNRGREGH